MPAVLFVCLGNICRSPAAEAVFRARAPADWTADSAGTGAWHVGKPPYGPMQTAARARGYDLSPLRARQLSDRDFHRFDLILGMDGENLADLRRAAPADAPAHLVPFLPGQDIPDPYYTGDFETALDLIEHGTSRLLADLPRP